MIGKEARPEQAEYWWREIYYKDFPANEKKGFFDFEAANEAVWLTEEAAAWVYEIVRRGPEVKQARVEMFGYGTWPPFPELHVLHQVALTGMIDQAAGFRPIASHPPPPGRLPKPGYSEAFPHYSFDLKADDKPLIESFMAWIHDQRTKFGCCKTTGKKAAARSHNCRDLPRRLDWRWVEVLDHQRGECEAPLSDTERGWRRDARSYGSRYHDLVLSAISNSDRETIAFLKALIQAKPELFGGMNVEKLDLRECHAAADLLRPMLTGLLLHPVP